MNIPSKDSFFDFKDVKKTLLLILFVGIFKILVTYQQTTCCILRQIWKRAWTKLKRSTFMKLRKLQESSFGVTTRATFWELPCS